MLRSKESLAVGGGVDLLAGRATLGRRGLVAGLAGVALTRIHLEEDTANNKHVVAAYATFWVLTVGFVLMMWRRQRALQADVARLELDLARALKEGGAA